MSKNNVRDANPVGGSRPEKRLNNQDTSVTMFVNRFLGDPIMKSVAIFVFLAILVSSPVLAYYPSSIWLYADEWRTHNSVFPELGGIYPYYVFILPGTDGLKCVEFRLSLPTSQAYFAPSYSSDIIQPILGSPEDGITLCYGTCQTDWTLCFSQSFYCMDNTTPSIIQILPFPGSYEPKAVSCLGDERNAYIGNDFGINFYPDQLGAQIGDVKVLSPTSIEVYFIYPVAVSYTHLTLPTTPYV